MTDWFMNSAGQTALAVTALTALVLLTRRAVSRQFGPRAAYALWALPILRLFMPSLMIPSAWVAPLLKPSEPAPVPMDAPFVYVPHLADQPAAPAGIDWADIAPTLLISVWILGMLVGAALLFARHVQYRRWVIGSSKPASRNLQEMADQVGYQLGLSRRPDLRMADECHGCEGPMVMGFLRPTILIPDSFERELTGEQQRLALLHEMMHVKRGDLWAAAAMMGFRLLNWPNPLIHWAWPRFRSDQEAACDASVLRLTGETARADYAETLLAAAQAFTPHPLSGRAGPASGIGLSLSLHHPIKERLMILGSNTEKHSSVSRWTLATLLLTGAALCAPISFAGDPGTKTEVKEKSVVRIVTSDSDEMSRKSFEIREEDGVTTYLRYKPDGSTEEITAEELESEFGVSVLELKESGNAMGLFPHGDKHRLRAMINGEPGLTAMLGEGKGKTGLRTMIIETDEDANYDVEVVDGVKRIYKIEEDGTRTEVEVKDMSKDIMEFFPKNMDGAKIEIIKSDKHVFKHGDGGPHSFFFSTDGNSGPASAKARLRSSQSMLEATERMIAGLKDDAGSDAQKDLRDAEKQLEKARKALKKAQEAVEKSNTQ